jgi:hypothetical protein
MIPQEEHEDQKSQCCDKARNHVLQWDIHWRNFKIPCCIVVSRLLPLRSSLFLLLYINIPTCGTATLEVNAKIAMTPQCNQSKLSPAAASIYVGKLIQKEQVEFFLWHMINSGRKFT